MGPHQRRKSQHQPQSREPLHLPCLNKRDQSLLWHPNSRMTEQMMMTMRPPASRRLLNPSTSKSQPPLRRLEARLTNQDLSNQDRTPEAISSVPSPTTFLPSPYYCSQISHNYPQYLCSFIICRILSKWIS